MEIETIEQDYKRLLHESEERFKILSEASIEGILIHDKGLIIESNSSFCKMVGYTYQEIIGMSVKKLTAPEYIDIIMHNINTQYENPYLAYALKKDGTRFPIEITGKMISYNGKTLRVGYVRDLSEKFKAEANIKESDRRFRELLENVQLISVILNEKGNVVFCNDYLCTISGYTKEEIVGKNWFDLLIPDETRRDLMERFFTKIFKGTVDKYIINPILTKDGKKRIIRWNNTMLKNELGNFIGTASIGNDITEASIAEEKLRDNEELFRSLFENAHDLIQSVGTDGKIIFVNKAWKDTLGYTAQDINSMLIFDIIKPEFIEHCKKLFQDVFSGKSFNNIEVSFITKDGDPILLEGNIFPKYLNEKIISTQAFFRNITERKSAEIKIKQLNDDLELKVAIRTLELENLNQELESFNYSVSHDLRGHLRNIDGFCKILLNETSNKFDIFGKACLDNIHLACERMTLLIDDLLKLSRISKMEIIKKPIAISKIVSDILNDYKRNDPNREIELHIKENITINGDENLIRLMIENLLSNAWKFCSQQKITKIEFNETKKENNTVYYIKDNGVGFNKKFENRLFKPFQRLHPSTQFEGIGIGLATVKRIIQVHGGNVWAESVENDGAVFYFTL